MDYVPTFWYFFIFGYTPDFGYRVYTDKAIEVVGNGRTPSSVASGEQLAPQGADSNPGPPEVDHELSVNGGAEHRTVS